MKRLYFDHAASSPLRPVARDALVEALARVHGNPSSAHAEGRAARRLLEEAREELARHLGCRRDELVFTSGGTESNALALNAAPPGAPILAAPIEHPSILRAAEARGTLRLLAVDAQGCIRIAPQDLSGASLAAVALVNHELGVLQDVAALARIAREGGVPLHCDATQAFGRVAFEFEALGVRSLSVSAHKIGGPAGIGALVLAEGQHPAPFFVGGGQEAGLRAGTESAVLAHAFAAAAAEARATLAERRERWRRLVELLRARLRAHHPSCVVHATSGEISNILSISFPGRSGAALVHRLDLEGVAVSHGSACSTGSLEPSPVLLALGLDEDLARSSLRVSFGPDDTPEDVEDFVLRLARALHDVQPRAEKKSSRDVRLG